MMFTRTGGALELQSQSRVRNRKGDFKQIQTTAKPFDKICLANLSTELVYLGV